MHEKYRLQSIANTQLMICLFEVLFDNEFINFLLQINSHGMTQALVECKRLHPTIQRFTILFPQCTEHAASSQHRTQLGGGIKVHGNCGSILIAALSFSKLT